MHYATVLPRIPHATMSPFAQPAHELGGNGGNGGHGDIAGGGQSCAQSAIVSPASHTPLLLQFDEVGQSCAQLALLSAGGSHVPFPHTAIGGPLPQSGVHVPTSGGAQVPSPQTGIGSASAAG